MCVLFSHPELVLAGVFQCAMGAALSLLQPVLSALVLQLQLLELLAQVLSLLAELGLQLLQGALRLRQLHLQTLLQQRDLTKGRSRKGERKEKERGRRCREKNSLDQIAHSVISSYITASRN